MRSVTGYLRRMRIERFPRAELSGRWGDFGRLGPTLFLFLFSSAVVFGGLMFSETFMPSGPPDVLAGICRWDGEHYAKIVALGYDYDEARGSRVAFFPAYPMTARFLSRMFSIGGDLALGVVSSFCFLGALLAMQLYLAVRAPAVHPRGEFDQNCDPRWRTFALLATAFMPTTFYFRMAYSESMFLLVAIIALYTMQRQCPLYIPALVIGLATAVRPVGVGLLVPFAWHIHTRSASGRQAMRRFLFLLPISCWGLLAYMMFQEWQFGQPFAFALTQRHWHMRPPGTVGDKVLSLLSWEPIRNVYLPGSPGYWREPGASANPLFNLQFANPIYFVGTAALIALGAWRRWLTAEEILMSAAFLAIPYFTRAYEMCMASQGRFAAVVFPAYIVIGQLLSRAGTLIAVALLAFAAFLMAAYAALFAANCPFF